MMEVHIAHLEGLSRWTGGHGFARNVIELESPEADFLTGAGRLTIRGTTITRTERVSGNYLSFGFRGKKLGEVGAREKRGCVEQVKNTHLEGKQDAKRHTERVTE